MRTKKIPFSPSGRKGLLASPIGLVVFVLILTTLVMSVLYGLDLRVVSRQEDVVNDQQFLSATFGRLMAEERFAAMSGAAQFLLQHYFFHAADGAMSGEEVQEYLQPMVDSIPDLLGFYFLPDPLGEAAPTSVFRKTQAGKEGLSFAMEAAARLEKTPRSREAEEALSGLVKVSTRRQMVLFVQTLPEEGGQRGALFAVIDLTGLFSRYVLPMAREGGFAAILHEGGLMVWQGEDDRIPDLEKVRELTARALSGREAAFLPGKEGGGEYLLAWNTFRLGEKRLGVILASPREVAAHMLGEQRVQRAMLVGALVLLAILGTFFLSRKQRQDEIRRSEASMRAVYDQVSSGIAILDGGGRFISCNGGWEAMMGLSEERLRQRSILDLVAPDSGPGKDALAAILAEEGETRRGEIIFIRAGGGSFWAGVTVTPLKEGLFSEGTLLAVINDISELKRSEDLLRQSATDLEVQKGDLERQVSGQEMLLDLLSFFSEAISTQEIYKTLAAALPAMIKFRDLFLCVQVPGEKGRYVILDTLGEVEKSGQSNFGNERKGILGQVLETGKAYIGGDLSTDPWYIPHSPEPQSLVAVPITRKGKDWGALMLDSAEKYAFGLKERDLLVLVGYYLALHLEEVEARFELDKTAKQLSFLHRVVQLLAAERTNEDLSFKIVDVLASELGFTCVGVFVPDEEEGFIPLVGGYELCKEGNIPSDLADEIKKAFELEGSVEKGEEGLKSKLAAPLSYNGEVFAVLAAEREKTFSSQEREILEIIAEHGATFWALNNLIEKRRHEALIDPLTQVWNRRYIVHRLEEESERISRNNGRGVVVLVDLGDFKSINDRFGHAAGDEVLRTAAALMKENVRACDMVGRYGGDEFLLYLPDSTVEQAAAAMERLDGRIAQLKVPGVDASIILDYGIASSPEDGLDLTVVTGTADGRMYENKAKRKGIKS